MPLKLNALPTTPGTRVAPNTTPLLAVARLGVDGGLRAMASNGYQATMVVFGGGTHVEVSAVEMEISSTCCPCWVCQKTPENLKVVWWAMVSEMSGGAVNQSVTGGSTHSLILSPLLAKSISATSQVGALAMTGLLENKAVPLGSCKPQFAALGSVSGSSPMVKVEPLTPLELPSVAWVKVAPGTFDWMMALRISDVPGVPTMGVVRRRWATPELLVGPRALPNVARGTPFASVKVSPGWTTRAAGLSVSVHGPGPPVAPFGPV